MEAINRLTALMFLHIYLNDEILNLEMVKLGSCFYLFILLVKLVFVFMYLNSRG